jgi:hypothetical protein
VAPLLDIPLPQDRAPTLAPDELRRRQLAALTASVMVAGQRSLERSALVESAIQLTRALDQIAALPATPALRREGIKLQVALITPLIHVKGYAAPETKAAVERARLLIEQAEALGEPPEDPLLLFSVLYGSWLANIVTFNGDACRDLAAHFLTLAEEQGATIPLMVAHRMMGPSLLFSGRIVESRPHLDRAIALYDPAVHRPLGMRFGQDVRVSILPLRSWALWILGYDSERWCGPCARSLVSERL